jgi:hypothetical protein
MLTFVVHVSSVAELVKATLNRPLNIKVVRIQMRLCFVFWVFMLAVPLLWYGNQRSR